MYLVFARKYRPETFDDVVGQGHVARTLQSAVQNDRVAHAYLFCGGRGVGKTTMARILAKALNCKEGPTAQPCGQCESCRRIAAGDDLDVLEIDGASNRGIDEIRNLRQNVKYAPAHSRFKIYYIDEVHMLTTPAFNALLKTLEEPPPHVKFIFSTTDPQQLLDTVKSRCQRFDFRLIADAEIIGHLGQICDLEKLSPEKGALQAIARAARGSLRDALGVLDQVAAFSEKDVKLEDVLTVLGAVNTQVLTQIVDALAGSHTGEALRIVHEALFSGVDLLDFADQLSEYLRDLLVASYCGAEDELLAGSAADAETLERQAGLLDADKLLYMLQVLREAKQRARRDTSGRVALEMAIVKFSRLDELVPLGRALEMLEEPPREAAHGGDAPARDEPRGRGAERDTRSAAQGQGGRLKGILDKIDNSRAPRNAPPPQGTEPPREAAAPQEASAPQGASVPEGMDPLKFRQIQKAADDRTALEDLQGEKPLMQAFMDADRTIGLNPLRLRGRGDKKPDEDPGSERPAE